MQAPEPTGEHEWLQRLVGRWTSTSSCTMPDGSTSTLTGSETVRSLGGLWIVAEGHNEQPDGQGGHAIIQLGFDPARGVFVGSFIASVMANLWLYEGRLEDGGRRLILEAEGPSFAEDGPARTAKYQDIIEIESPDVRYFHGQIQMPDGSWNRFMTSRYTRVG